MSRLENKVVLISGGASGIGAATARLVVREGGKAVLADRDEAKGRALAGELGDAALFAPLDVTDEAAWNKAVATTVETFGGLHGLLNAAGVGVRNSIEDCTLADYRRLNDINGLGT
ncbi:MAG TPA: SDR family NAD(P)-dependent oxidoreductase, partial [Reyranella sp.]|nr:SDR family NAD(P)-dependent oxidoreductase [Reyranella sp.]